MFSKTSAATAENVPEEERRRRKIQVLPLNVAGELVGQAPNSTRRNWFKPRSGVLSWCWAGEAAVV